MEESSGEEILRYCNSHNNDNGVLLHGWPGCKLLTLNCDTNSQDGTNIVKKLIKKFETDL